MSGEAGRTLGASRAEEVGNDILAIDTLTAGMSKVTAGYLLPAPRPTLIECGPALSIANVIDGLEQLGLGRDDLAYLVLTHIHLDHAGGAGDLAQAFPSAQVVVSEIGAPHLEDPGKLNASSRRVYGELMDAVYGECTPIDGDRLVAVADGDALNLGAGRRLELMYTPGHAKHHIGIWDSATGAVFSGDSVGVKVPGMRELRPATPPPDFHLEAATRSIQRYLEREPTEVFLAHYGALDAPEEGLRDAIERLHLWVETAEAAYEEHDELDHVVQTLGRRFADEVADDLGGDAAETVQLLTNVTSNAAGIVRYLRRRDEGTLTPVG